MTLKLIFEAATEILPKSSILTCETIRDRISKLYEAEEQLILDAVPKRRMEFRAGRICARNGLRKLGLQPVPILVGRNREPIWPSSISGSITHEKDICLCAVARKSDLPLLGIDLASDLALDKSLNNIVCTEKEIRTIQNWNITSDTIDPYKLVFSIKESIFKCLFPVVQKVFDFHDVEVVIDMETNSVSISLINEGLFPQLNYDLNCKFCTDDGYIFAATWQNSPLD